jgi:exosortase A-associated hydrolase 2
MTPPREQGGVEEPCFFPGGAAALFGVLHRPARPVAAEVFVFCHPFAEEKLWAHRAFVLFARHLAASGYPVLRFDHMGNGDSEGEFSQASFATAQQDVRHAIAYARAQTGATAITLLGLRLGATVASLIAETEPSVHRLVSWAPVVDGDRYMQEVLRTNVTSQMAAYKEIRQERPDLVVAMQQGASVNIDGYEMTYPMYAEVAAVKLGATPARFTGPCLIVQVDRQARPSAELQKLASSYGNATVTFAQEEPFWKEIARSYQRPAGNLFAVTSDWLGIR